MKKEPINRDYWCICEKCKGMGQLNKRLRKKIRLAYKNALAAYLKNPQIGIEPIKPKSIFEKCKPCEGSGLIKTQTAPVADTENIWFLFFKQNSNFWATFFLSSERYFLEFLSDSLGKLSPY